MALNITVKVLGTLVDILAQMHLGNYNFSLLSATSLCDHQNLSPLTKETNVEEENVLRNYSNIKTINGLATAPWLLC